MFRCFKIPAIKNSIILVLIREQPFRSRCSNVFLFQTICERHSFQMNIEYFSGTFQRRPGNIDLNINSAIANYRRIKNICLLVASKTRHWIPPYSHFGKKRWQVVLSISELIPEPRFREQRFCLINENNRREAILLLMRFSSGKQTSDSLL